MAVQANPQQLNRFLREEFLTRHGRELPTDEQLEKLDAKLMAWYRAHGRKFRWRRSKLTTYELVITEALLQRTRAETVNAFIPTFMSRFPNWNALARAPQEELEEALRPIGLHKRRAASLRRLANRVVQLGGRIPRDQRALAELPGLGQYQVYAIAMYRQNEPLPLLDASMARLLERLFGQKRILVDIRYDPYLQQLSRRVVSSGNPKHKNWALLDVAAKYCRPKNPKCHECPLRQVCCYTSPAKSCR